MASLAFGMLGQAVGGTLGGVIGGQIGWALGSMLGASLFAEDIHNEGPRLSDLTVTSSTYGAPIPKVYGRSRIAGNTIWSSGINETTHSQEVGGKGGGGQTHTTYTYDASFAIGLCEGEIIGIGRIWADGILIYSNTSLSTDEEVAVSEELAITVYTGSETQEVDPLIEADKGVDNVSANRGLAYIVFDQLQLEKYGNRIPNLTFEVVANGYFSNIVDNTWDLNTGFTIGSGSSWFGPYYFDGNNTVYHQGERQSDGAQGTWTTDKYGNNKTAWVYETNLIEHYRVAHSLNSNYTDIKFLSKPWTPPYTYYDNLGNIYSDGGYDNDRDEWWVSFGCNAIVVGDVLYRVALPDEDYLGNKYYQVFRGWDLTSILGTKPILHEAAWIEEPYHNTRIQIWYDEARESLFVQALRLSGDKLHYVREYDLQLNLIKTWATQSIPVAPICVYDRVLYQYNKEACGAGYGYFISWILNDDSSISGPSTYCANPPTEIPLNNSWVYYIGGNKIMSAYATLKINNLYLNAANVKDIIEDICDNAGVPSTDLVTSLVTDQTIGFVRSKQLTARSAIDPLLLAYNIKAVESDYKLKFSNKDGSIDKTIIEDQLAAHVDTEENSDKVITRRIQETDLPRRVLVSYSEPARDYIQATQKAQRIID